MQIYAEYARFQIRFVGRRDRVDEGYIFRRLFGNDVERVVYGDDAYEQVFLIDDGNGQKIVFGKRVRNVFLVGQGIRVHEIVLHEIFHALVVRMQEQIFHRHDSQKFFLIVGHVAGIDGLLVDRLRADLFKTLLHGHVLPKGNALGGHDAARAVLGIF